MLHLQHEVDVCVVGGGMAGLCAAVAAARHGANVALINDRPVLGGNASSEIRMWLCGAQALNLRETGIIEEINLENNFRNPTSNFSIWDSILYEFGKYTPGIQLFLNCSVYNATMNGTYIASVTGWQGTSETKHTFFANIFIDCSGDSVLATLTGAEFRIGREAKHEFGEDIEPTDADRKTMGMSCLIQARETNHHTHFTPPKWARTFNSDADLPQREHGFTGLGNFWWMELGGEDDSIHDTDTLRDKLLPIAFGVWDHIKNHGNHGADNWELDWVGFLPGKRESRRYLGPCILTQNDIRAEGRFDDIVAYGGWSMDDHNPGGFNYSGTPTIYHHAPKAYGIPYRCLYSRNITNLMFAGRNISVTHAALSSTRVMATCATVGQAAGTAAAIATAKSCSPAGVYELYIRKLQQMLMDDDCFIPWRAREVSPVSRTGILSASQGDPTPLINGLDRPTQNPDGTWNNNDWQTTPGGFVQFSFNTPLNIHEARIIFDSNLNRMGQGACSKNWEKNILSNFPLNQPPRTTPDTIVKAFRIEALQPDGNWLTVTRMDDNHQRLVILPTECKTAAVRLIPEQTWGAPLCRLFAFEVR